MPQPHISRFVQSVIDAQRAVGEANSAAANSAIYKSLATHSTFPETQVYIGLNDSETKRQEYDTERYVSILKKICIEHGTPFSFDIINGGYIHDDGEYTEEKTIMLTFINVAKETVEEIAQDLCTLFNQESVLITTSLVKAQMVRSASSIESKESEE